MSEETGQDKWDLAVRVLILRGLDAFLGSRVGNGHTDCVTQIPATEDEHDEHDEPNDGHDGCGPEHAWRPPGSRIKDACKRCFKSRLLGEECIVYSIVIT